jgi:hypothetical protein
LLNTALFEHGLVMTASAIGDNLVKSVFEHFGKTKPKLLVQRGLTPREMLQSSSIVRIYRNLLQHENDLFGLRNAKVEPRTAMTKPIQVFENARNGF